MGKLYKPLHIPSIEQVEAERERLRQGKRFRKALSGTVGVLVVVAALAVLVATLLLPVLQISGTSMEPTLYDGDIVVLVKGPELHPGELCAFSYQNKVLIKRIIATPGDRVEIDGEGTVFVNGEQLDEPYVTEKSLGECDITFPYYVPENRVFVMGDHRETSIEELRADEGERMLSSDWDLTLYTCTYSGTSRTTIRCDRVK